MVTNEEFRYVEMNVSQMLPPDWRVEVAQVVRNADFRRYPRTPIISREDREISEVLRGRVTAEVVQRDLPWLFHLYATSFLDLARSVASEEVFIAKDLRYGIILNVQYGESMRFECHVDSNPLTGVLYLSDHGVGEGGELVISNDTNARGVTEIEEDCILVHPEAGKLIFLDGRYNPHYVRPLKVSNGMRVCAAMNFYVSSFPESTRPAILNKHRFGDTA